MKLLFISAIIFLLDQYTKWLAKSKLALRESIEIIGDIFKLTHIQNSGMAFGIVIPNKYIFNALSLIAAFAILYYLIKFRNEKFLPRFALAVIFGGATGNLLDRLLYGRVVDFFDVDIPDIHITQLDFLFISTPEIYLPRWPIFNIADIAVSTGMFLLMYTIFAGHHDMYQENSIEESVAAEK